MAKKRVGDPVINLLLEFIDTHLIGILETTDKQLFDILLQALA